VRWSFGRNSLVLFLLLFSSLMATQPVTAQQSCGFANGDLYVLPACAIVVEPGGMYTYDAGQPADFAYLTAVAPQTLIASPGQNLTFTVSYQVWLTKGIATYAGTPLTQIALLFIGSWTPRSPTDYWIVYSGIPPLNSPGKTGSATFHLTAPFDTGTYYLWFCLAFSADLAGSQIVVRPPITSAQQELRPPGHIKLIVSSGASTVTVTAKPSTQVVSHPLSIPLVPVGVGGIMVAVVGSVVVAVRRGKLRFRSAKAVTASEPTLSTGYADLDGTLAGGIPEGYAVVLVSPSYDERDLLLRKIIDSAIKSGRPTFYISADIKRTQDLLTRYKSGFYAFSPQAARIEPKPPNLFQLPTIDNLNDHTLSLSLAIRDARAKEKSGKMLLVLDTLSNIVLHYKTLTTTRWLTDFVGKRKAEGFTIVGTLNPLSISKEEVQAVVDLFDGVIEIFEKELKERSRRFVVVKKMYGKNYSESELLLDKAKLF